VRRGQKRGMGLVPAGILTVVIALAASYFAITKSLPFGGHHEVRAVFRTANNVKPNSLVRIAGVNVGKVTKVEAVQDGGDAAIITMRIDDKGLPLHRDATVRIRPRIFLEGNFFLDVSPGSPSAPELEDGATIPVNQTSAPVQVDQVLSALKADTRKSLQGLLDELGRGLEGGARGYQRSIRFWEPAYRDSATVNEATLGVERHDLSGYLRGATRVARGLDADPAALQALITDFRTTAAAFSEHDGALRRAVAELPRTLRAAQPALGTLNAAFPPLRRLVADLRPGVRSSGPALEASMPFVRELRGLVSEPELRGLVRDLRPVVPDLAALNRGSVPLYEQVRAASSCQNEVILPWTKDKIVDATFPARGRVFEESTKFLPGIAGESRSGDANGQWFRVLLGSGNFANSLGGDRFFLTNSPIIGTNPPKPAKRSPLRPDVPCETQERPDLRTIPMPAPPSREIRIPADRQDDYERIVRRAVRKLNDQLEQQGLDKKLKAVTTPATRETLARVRQVAAAARRAGR